MAVKIYIVKIYDPLRQCSSSKVVAVWCEKVGDSGKRRKGESEKHDNRKQQQQQAEDASTRGIKSRMS